MRSRLSAFAVALVCLFAVPALAAPDMPPAPDMERPAPGRDTPAPVKEKPVPVREKPGSMRPADDREAPRPEKVGSYSGNTKSRVFHAANCRYAGCKTCTEHFRSAEEARKNGYKPCKRCIR